MAKSVAIRAVSFKPKKKTSIGGRVKTSSMNKAKRANYKKPRGQGS